MFFKKKVRLGLILVLLLTLILGVGLGSICAREIKRVVRLEIMADEEFREYWGPICRWKEVIREIVEKASRAFEEQFGIRFEIIEFKEWNSEYSFAFLRDTFFELRAKPDKSIIIAFTGQGDLQIKYGAAMAAADCGGRYVLVVDYRSSIPWFKKHYEDREEDWTRWCIRFTHYYMAVDLSTTLAHEIGHLFGAVHVSKPSVMRARIYLNQGKEFDEANRRIISENLKLDFQEIEALRKKARILKFLAAGYEMGLYRDMLRHKGRFEGSDELFPLIAENRLEAGQTYEKIPLISFKAQAVEMYKKALYYLKELNKDEEVRKIYRKIGLLLVEIARCLQRFGEKGKDEEAFRLYKEAASCFEKSGSKEELEMIYQECEKLDEKYGWGS